MLLSTRISVLNFIVDGREEEIRVQLDRPRVGSVESIECVVPCDSIVDIILSIFRRVSI